MKEVWILLLLGVCCCQAQDWCKFTGKVCSWSATAPEAGTLDSCLGKCQADGTCLALTLRTGGATTCSFHTEVCGEAGKVLNPGQATDFVYTKLGTPGLSESSCTSNGGSTYTDSAGAGGPQPYLLVIEDTEIASVSLDGSTRTTVLSGLAKPNNVAVSSVNGYIFYSDPSADSIYRAKLDGSGVTAIITGVQGPFGLMVLDRLERLYWSDTTGGVVESSDFDGNNRMVLAQDLTNVMAIAIDDINSKLYFITDPYVGEVLLDGSNVNKVTTEIQNGMQTTVLIHSPSRTAYFHMPDQTAIVAVNIDGDADGGGDQQQDNPDVAAEVHRGVAKRAADVQPAEVLTTQEEEKQREQVQQQGYRLMVQQIQACLGLAVVNYLGEDQLFYTDSVATLSRVSVAGGNPVIVMEGLNAPGRIAVVDPSVYVDPGLPRLTSEALDTGAIKFTCRISVRDDGHDQFKIEWKSDVVVIETSDITGHVSTLTMTNAEAAKRGMGGTLECVVRTRTVVGGQTSLGSAISSNVWRAQCEVGPTTLNLVEGGGAKAIEVKCNAPPASFGGDFSLHVELVRVTNELRTTDGKVIDQVVVEVQEGSTSHVVQVTADNWWLTFSFKCKAVIDGKVESIQESTRQMRVIRTVSDGHTTIDTVTIRIRDRDRYSVCSAVNDPHCRSADGRNFECQAQGAFVFYRSKIFNYQIVLVFQPCSTWGPSPTCTCAVFIQVDSLVWVFHKCITAGASPYATPLNIYVLAPAGPIVPNVQIIQVASSWGTKYYVIMPHGGVLSITFSMGFLNAYYAPSPADWNNMCGLCGNFDGNPDNDFTMRDGTLNTPASSWNPTVFVNEWRMSDEDSVLTGVSAEVESSEERVYCSVMEEIGEVCVPGMDVVAQATEPEDDDIAAEIATKFKFASDPNNRNKFAAPAKRKKRAAETTYTGFDPYAPIVADLEHVPTAASWPTQSGRTEAEVTSFCSNSINDHAGVQLCSTMLSDDFGDVITECIWDIQSTDNVDWVDQAIAGILKRCTIHADKVDNSAADGDPPPPLPNGVDRTALFAAVCPNDCSGNGTCTDGACACTGDYVGADCSMHLTDPPEVTVLFETFCDLSSRSCAEAIVFGDKFHNRPTLTCHIHEYTLGSPLPTGPATEVLAQFTKFDQIACPMPEGHRPHILQVSNDGTNMAAARRLFAPHHLDCFSCSMAGDDITTATCTRKPRTCVIDGSCYQDGDRNPDGGCGTCDSAKSVSSWSGCGLGLDLIIGIVAAVVVGVIVMGVLIGVAYYFIKRANKPSTPEAKLVRRVSTDGKVHPDAYA